MTTNTNHSYLVESTLRRLFEAIRQETGVTKEVLQGKDRQQPIARARSVFYAILRREVEMTLHDYGVILNRDHATVIHCVTRHSKLMREDWDYQKTYGLVNNAFVEMKKMDFTLTSLLERERMLLTEREAIDGEIRRVRAALIEEAEEIHKEINAALAAVQEKLQNVQHGIDGSRQDEVDRYAMSQESVKVVKHVPVNLPQQP